MSKIFLFPRVNSDLIHLIQKRRMELNWLVNEIKVFTSAWHQEADILQKPEGMIEVELNLDRKSVV